MPDRHHRIEVFMDAYGAAPIADVATKVAGMQRSVGEHEAYLAKRRLKEISCWFLPLSSAV